LAVSVSMTVPVAIMIGSFRQTVIYWVGQTLKADLYVGPSSRSRGLRSALISDDVEAAVAAQPGGESVDPVRTGPAAYEGREVALIARDFETLQVQEDLLFKSPSNSRQAVQRAIAKG